MIDAHKSHEVLDALGQKVVDGIGQAVAATRRDFRAFRVAFPGFAADATQRGLKNFIHDRLFANAVAELGSMPGVSIVDEEPTRDIYVGQSFRVRLKAHDQADLVSAYPTQASLDFFAQGPQPTIPSLEEIRLIAGYRWDAEERQMHEAVISLRDGRMRVLWAVELVEDEVAGATHFQPHELPPLPGIESTPPREEEQSDDI